MNRLVVIALTCAACSRSDNPPPDTRIAAVTSETTSFVAGLDGVRVSVVVVNDSEREWTLEQARLKYQGAGELRATPLRQTLPLLAPRSTATVPFLVHLPGIGEGAAEIDAEARIVDYDGGDARILSEAESPLRFQYTAQPPDPDLTDLPILLVTTTDDELDGGETLADVAGAGGAGDLSFREALTLCNNQGTPYRIMFDPVVFPPPIGDSILFGALEEPPTVRVAGTAIDGLDAAVTLGMDPNVSIGWFWWHIAAPAVVLRNITLDVSGYNGGGVTLSGCHDCAVIDVRFTTYDGDLSVEDSQRVRVRGLTITAGDRGFSANQCDDLLIEDSYSAGSFEINDCTGTIIRNNTGSVGMFFDVFASPNTWIVGNTFDSVFEAHVDVSGDCAGTVIADNTAIDSGVWNGAIPVLRVATSQRVTMSHNLMIRANADPIIELVPGANADLAAPIIAAATSNTVAGTASAPDGSVVELYADPSGGLERWLGDVVVAGGAFSLSGLSLPSGDKARATVTDVDGNTSGVSAAVEIP